jgi:hypothetical protein
MIPLDQQIAELKREAALRKNVYPTFIARQRMTEAEAQKHQERLSAAITTLEWLQRNETKIREAIGERSSDA